LQPEELSQNHPAVKLSTAPFIAEMSTLTVLFQRLLPFSPITSSEVLPSPHTIFSYSVHLPDIRPPKHGGAALVLVFFKMSLEVQTPGTFIDMGKYLDSSPEKDPQFETPMCREIREKGCVIVTAFTWSGPDDRTVKFWMREDVMDRMRNTVYEWGCALWRVDDWLLISAPADASNAVKGEQWTCSSTVDVMEM
jgi:hypothetical protein